MIDLMKNGLKFYVKKNMKIVWNDNEKQAELLCKKEQTVCNVNEEWAEVLCKENRLSGMTIKNGLNFYVNVTGAFQYLVVVSHQFVSVSLPVVLQQM